MKAVAFIKKHKIIFSIFFLWLVAVQIPKWVFQDQYSIDTEEKNCAVDYLSQSLDNPLRKGLVVKAIIKNKSEDVIHLVIYSFFGIKISDIKLICNEQERRILSQTWP